MQKLLLLAAVISVSSGAEWVTSREQHCIERCEVKEKLGLEAYVCYTVDGYHKEYRKSTNTESGKPAFDGPIPGLDDDVFPWDFCTPALVQKLDEEEKDDDSDPNLKPDNTDQGNQGGQGWNPGAPKAKTSVSGIDCSGPCTKGNNGAYMCDSSHSSNKMYCSPDFPLRRQQITSHNKVWCIDECRNGITGDHFCKTLIGEDICSRDKGFSTKGTQCESACAVWPESTTNFLTCKIGEGLYEACGNWDTDSFEKKTAEFTHEGQVCASPCIEFDGEHLCSYAQWKEEGSEEDPKAVLYMMEGHCGPESDTDWQLIGIIIGAVVGAIILIAIIGICVSKKTGYNRTATREP